MTGVQPQAPESSLHRPGPCNPAERN